MKLFIKKLLLVLFVLLFFVPLFSQTSLPTSWDCTPGTMPNGWTTNITGFYTSSTYIHSPPNAVKFDASGIFMTINFADEPDTLTYYLRGAYFSGGTFDIQQSVNGSIWTVVRSFTNANIPANSLANATPFKDLLAANSRFVRFIYTYKGSGNVCVDDILIGKRPPGPEASISIKINDQFAPSGGIGVIGNATSVSCRVINSGTDSVLRITAANLSGTNASMFNVTGIPLNVPPNDSATFTLNFTASGADGSKTATLTLPNNDTDNTPYVINIWGVKGCCATEPLLPPNNVNFSFVKSFKFRVNFSDPASPPENYLMLKKSSPIIEEPLDGHTYLKGDYIGYAQVAYIGPSGYFYPANVVANTHYYIKIFPYNGFSGYENYLTANPAAIDTTTLPNMIDTYYDAINLSTPSLWQDLHTLINAHTTLYYSDYDSYMINTFESRDTVVAGRSQKALTCAYSGENYVYTEPFAFTLVSREHVFCESWMPTYTSGGYTSLPEYSDYHNLLPVDQNKVNVYRLNYPLGIVDSVTYQFMGCKKGLDSLGHVVFEPRDSEKGDAARCMFYQVLCYDGVNGNDWQLPQVIDSSSAMYGQKEALLKKWNLQDPPDNYEIARNDNIYYWQANRNPFIDHPEWADWFGFGVNSSVGEFAGSNDFSLYPNPTHGSITLTSKSNMETVFSLYDITGAAKYSVPIKANSNKIIDLSRFSNGLYFYRLTDGNKNVVNGKLVIY
jgi:hypothetical protein